MLTKKLQLQLLENFISQTPTMALPLYSTRGLPSPTPSAMSPTVETDWRHALGRTQLHPRKVAPHAAPTFRPMSIVDKRSPISATAELLWTIWPFITQHPTLRGTWNEYRSKSNIRGKKIEKITQPYVPLWSTKTFFLCSYSYSRPM